MEKGQFIISAEFGEIDVAELSPDEIQAIKDIAKEMIKSGEAKEPCLAYVAAFTMWLADMEWAHQGISPGEKFH